jgi:hypothetical protein
MKYVPQSKRTALYSIAETPRSTPSHRRHASRPMSESALDIDRPSRMANFPGKALHIESMVPHNLPGNNERRSFEAHLEASRNSSSLKVEQMHRRPQSVRTGKLGAVAIYVSQSEEAWHGRLETWWSICH